MIKRLAAYGADILALAALATAAGLILPPQAYAYVDPSVMTYTIQAVAGAAVALSAVIGVAFRRSRRLIFRLFKIDENAGKEVEPAVHSLQDAPDASLRLEAADSEARALKERLAHGTPARRLGWGRRLVRSLICCAFLMVSAFTAPSLEIVSGAQASLNFSLQDVLPLVLGASAAIALAASLALSLARGRAFDIACALIVAAGIGCYVQALFLNGPLPAADGTPLHLSNYKTITVISGAVWLAIFAGALVLALKKVAIARGLGLVLCVGLLAVQGASLASLASEAATPAPKSETTFNGLMTTEGIYELGAHDNVVVFVLDTYDTAYLKEAVADHPDLLDSFTGFTWFQNATSAMTPTRYGIPYLLTGTELQPGQSHRDYVETRYAKSTLIPSVKEAGYDVGIYTDTLLTNRLTPYASNLYDTNHLRVNPPGLLGMLAKVSLYRDMPWILKKPFWFYTDQINQNSLDATMDSYIIDDPALYQGLKQQGLSIGDEPKAFRFIHTLGAHGPLCMDENGNRGTEETLTWEQQWVGSINFVSDYLDEMKRLGIYDDATIVVTADHGEFGWTWGPADHPSSAMLLVKPRETPEEAARPLEVSQIPTGALDYAATIIDAVGADRSGYGPTVWEVTEEADRDRYYWHTVHNDNIDHEWIRYRIGKGDVLDWDNWEPTGETTPVEVHD